MKYPIFTPINFSKMFTQLDKKQESTKSRSATEAYSATAQLSQVNDQRTETAQRKKLQNLVNDSAIAIAQRQTLDKLKGVTQKVDLEDETTQKKSVDVHQFNIGLDGELPLQKKDDENANHAITQQVANNTGLPDHLKVGIENLSGMSLDHVKVHYNSDKPAQLSALAYAQGSDIHVGAGQEQHLPHEAWHVVQQMQGRVQPTLQAQGVDINDDTALETEADIMGAKALQS